MLTLVMLPPPWLDPLYLIPLQLRMNRITAQFNLVQPLLYTSYLHIYRTDPTQHHVRIRIQKDKYRCPR